jgi:hypothetical protein
MQRGNINQIPVGEIDNSNSNIAVPQDAQGGVSSQKQQVQGQTQTKNVTTVPNQ